MTRCVFEIFAQQVERGEDKLQLPLTNITSES